MDWSWWQRRPGPGRHWQRLRRAAGPGADRRSFPPAPWPPATPPGRCGSPARTTEPGRPGPRPGRSESEPGGAASAGRTVRRRRHHHRRPRWLELRATLREQPSRPWAWCRARGWDGGAWCPIRDWNGCPWCPNHRGSRVCPWSPVQGYRAASSFRGPNSPGDQGGPVPDSPSRGPWCCCAARSGLPPPARRGSCRQPSFAAGRMGSSGPCCPYFPYSCPSLLDSSGPCACSCWPFPFPSCRRRPRRARPGG
mmetsp:Transcript_3689/g.10489  ORF Transcript_3689/g.10489 Transcript_3689/m.10489 type:complete len:252 (+) Transcript_3689:1362-2117(+)